MADETAFTLDEQLQPVLDGLAAGFELLIGAQHLGEHDAPPRIVWVPDNDAFDAGYQREADRRVRLDAWTGLAAHLWCDTITAARELRRAVLIQLHKAFSVPRLRFVGGLWLRGDVAEWLRDGQCYVLRFQFREAVWEQPLTTVAIEHTDLAPRDDSASGDNNLDFGEP
jgi:hypothetical protein